MDEIRVLSISFSFYLEQQLHIKRMNHMRSTNQN